MTIRFTSLFRSYLAPLAPFALTVAVAGCNGAVPHVSGHNLVIPDRSPSRQVQALDTPSTNDAAAGSSGHENAFCQGGSAGSQTSADDGSFDNFWNCEAGGGMTTIENKGIVSPTTGDGAYDQITTFDDGTTSTFHFTVDSSDDFLTQTYVGSSDDGSETMTSVYTYNANDFSQVHVHEIWTRADGTYTIDGDQPSDGSSFAGTESFDDPSTAASPDWSMVESSSADGSFSQTVHFNGAGFVSDYTYAVGTDGVAQYSFATDLDTTQVSPDYDGAYTYNADGSGNGSYTQHFDDGSTDLISDVINNDGTMSESWSFDDVSTEQSVDQEGTLNWALDGSAEGTVTTHVVGGGEQTCDIHISADGAQTVDNCS